MIFTEKHDLIRKLARDFAETELTGTILDEIEETEQYPKEILDKMGKAGFFGIKTPREYGGQGSDNISYVIVLEEIARVSAVSAIWAGTPNALGSGRACGAGPGRTMEYFAKNI